MSKTTTTIIILLVIAVGGFLLFGTGNQQQQPQDRSATTTESTTTSQSNSNDATTSSQSETDLPPATTQNEGPAATVTYSNGQFQPETVTISRGETVRFESEGGDMWVGSNQHPTHTQYDGTGISEHCQGGEESFDQCETGQGYSFTFDKAGEFGYHNHVNPSAGGTIIVE